jgi:hypothetical protein
MGQFREKQ